MSQGNGYFYKHVASSRPRTSSVGSADGASSMAILATAKEATSSRLREGIRDDNEGRRLERRLENLQHLETLFSQNPSLELIAVFGWGEGCFGAQPGQGVSEFDTFFIRDGRKEMAIQLDSAYQIQVELQSRQTMQPAPINRPQQRYTVAMSLSQSGRVYEKTADGFLPQYLYQNQVYHSAAKPHGISLLVSNAGPPAARIDGLNMGAKSTLSRFIATVSEYQSKVTDPIFLDVLDKMQQKIGVEALEVRPLLDSGKSSAFAVIHGGRINVGFDASDEGWPLVAASSLDLSLNSYTSANASFLKRMTGREDWPSKWFFFLINTVSQDDFFHLNIQDSLQAQIGVSPEVAKTILQNIVDVPVNQKAMRDLEKHISDKTTNTRLFAEKEHGLLMKAFQNPDTTCAYTKFEDILRFSDRFELVAQAVSCTAAKMNMPRESLMRAMAYHVKTWAKVSDRFGICCPSCADKGECALPKPALSLSHVETVELALPDLARVGSLTDISGAVQELLSRVMVRLGETERALNPKVAAFFDKIQNEPFPDDFRLASVLGYLIDLHDVISDYDPKGFLKAEKTWVLRFSKAVMSQIVPKENAPYGLEVQTRICHFLTLLETQNLLTPEEKSRFESLYPMVLVGEEASEYANRYQMDFYEKATVRDMSRPLSDALRDLSGPLPIDILNGDLGSGKTTFSHQAVHRGGKRVPRGKLPDIFEIYNDITPGLDSTKSQTHLSTLTVAKGALAGLNTLPGFSFQEVSAEKAYAKTAGDPKLMLAQETGCLCCTNRVGFGFRVSEVARGLRGWGAQGVWTEITGIGDGSGAAGISFWPGRTYVRSLSAVLNPADERWSGIPDQGERDVAQYACDLAAWFADDAGLVEGTPEHRLHKRQEILWEQLAMATHYFINLRSAPQNSQEQAMKEKMIRIIHARLNLEHRQADIFSVNFKHMCRWEAGKNTWQAMQKLNPAEILQTGKCFAFSQLEKDMGPSETVVSGMEPRSMAITLSPTKDTVRKVLTDFCKRIFDMAISGENRQIDRLKGYVKIAVPQGMPVLRFKAAMMAAIPRGGKVYDTQGGVLLEVEVGAGALMWVGGVTYSGR